MSKFVVCKDCHNVFSEYIGPRHTIGVKCPVCKSSNKLNIEL